jgi:hypothetical protein
MATFLDALNDIADAETRFAEIVRSLVALHDAGALKWSDLAVYERLRVELYVAQLTAYGNLAYQIRSYLPAAVAAQIPAPQFAPNFPLRPNFGAGTTPQAARPSQTAGLGNPIIIVAAGGVTITLSFWAVVIIGLLAVAVIGAAIAAVVYAVLATEEMLQKAQRADQDAQATQTYYATVRACLAAGQPIANCVHTVPLPNVVRPPDANPDPLGLAKWPVYLAWGAGGLAVTVLAFAYLKYSGGHERVPRLYRVE